MTGVSIARERRSWPRLLLGMALFSFVCLPFVGLFPSVAALNFGIDVDGATYKWLYADVGRSARASARSAVGTVLAHIDQRRLIVPRLRRLRRAASRRSALRALARPAFPVGFVLGFSYFAPPRR